MNAMNAPWTVIQTLEGNPSKNFKIDTIAKEALSGNDTLFAGVRLALDSLITFGVAKIPVAKKSGTGLSWTKFNTDVQLLVDRQVTGNMARDLVDTLMSQATQEQWNDWYRRILIKDMRCGCSESSFNKGAKKAKRLDYVVPVFEVQLAFDSKKHDTKMTGVKRLENKCDGVRFITVVHPNGTVEHFSRNGKVLSNFPHLTKQFANIAVKEAMVFDGEVMSAKFQDLMKQLNRKSNVQTTDASVYLFDMLPLTALKAGKYNKAQSARSAALEALHAKYADKIPNIRLLDHEDVDLDTEAGVKRFREINKAALALGYEGLLIKDVTAGYKCKRSVAWLKIKPVIEVSLTVVAVEEGTGKNAGSLGALVCEGTDDGIFLSVNVGSGLSDEQRAEIWANKKKVIGMVAEIRADVITQSQDGAYSLRFPRFIRWRGFEEGEKL